MMKTLQCDMSKDCPNSITHISEKGFIYCRTDGLRRRSARYERVRKLRAWELRLLEQGDVLPSYKPLPKPKPVVKTDSEAQS
jgi:hypothetical protein